MLVLSRQHNLTLGVTDGRPHLLHNCPYLLSFYTDANLYCLETEAQRCEQLA